MNVVQKTIRFDRGHGLEEGVLYRWPRIEKTRFSSPLVNERNLELSAGPDSWLVERVTTGLKPICFIDSEDKQELVGLVDNAMAAGCGVIFQPHVFRDGRRQRDHYFAAAAAPGVIGEAFDIESLVADYYDYLEPLLGRELVEPIEAELHRIAGYRFSDFLNFSSVEVEWDQFGELPLPAATTALPHDHRRYPETVARCGLLLGYPVETSVALICDDFGIPGAGTTDIRRRTSRAAGSTA